MDCHKAPMDGFTAFLDKCYPCPAHSENAQTENCWLNDLQMPDALNAYPAYLHGGGG